MKKLSKILIPILLIALVMGAFFVFASAEDEMYEASVGNKKYETFEEAIKAANKAGGDTTVVVLKPVIVEEQLKIDTSMTIDLNGNTITYHPAADQYFQAFMTVNADKTASGITVKFVGEGCLDVIDARMFNLKSTKDAPASVIIEGSSEGYGTYLHHQGQYSSIIAGEGASLTINNATLYLSGNCIDNNGKKDSPASIQLDQAGATVTIKNATVEQKNTKGDGNADSGIFRIAGDGAAVIVEDSTLKTTGSVLTVADDVNKDNNAFEMFKVTNSVIAAENFDGGKDRIINMSESIGSGTVVIKDSRLTSSKIVYSTDSVDSTGNKLTLKLDNVDVTNAYTKSSYTFVTGQVYVVANNCRISSDGILGAMTDSSHFSFTDCVFSAKVSDGDGAVAGGKWYLTYASPSHPWVYLTEAPEKFDNADYLSMQNYDGIVLDNMGAHMEGSTFVTWADRIGNFSSFMEATIKTGYAHTENLDGNTYFRYEIVDFYKGTDKESKDGTITNNKEGFAEASGFDAYYVFGPGHTSDFKSAALKLADFETVVFDLDIKGTAQGFADVSHLMYHRLAAGTQINTRVIYTTGNKIILGNETDNVTFELEDPTTWQHIQVVYRIAETKLVETPEEPTEQTPAPVNEDTSGEGGDTTTGEGDDTTENVPQYERSYVGKIDIYYNGELVKTIDCSYASGSDAVDPSLLYLGGLRQVVAGSKMKIGASVCYDNVNIRGYKNEATRVTTSSSEAHKEDNEVSGVMIGDTVYNTLAEAIAAALPSDTIVLYKDVSDESIELTKSVKIVSNGYGIPTFTYIDKANSSVYSYSPIYAEGSPYKVLVIDENNHPQYLYPSLSTDFVVLNGGEIMSAGNGSSHLVNAIKNAASGDVVVLKTDITLDTALTIPAKSFAIDLTGHKLTLAGDVGVHIPVKSANTELNIYSSVPGAQIVSMDDGVVFTVSAAATLNVGTYTDPNTGAVYSGDNITVTAVALAEATAKSAVINLNGGTYVCAGKPNVSGSNGGGFFYIETKTTTNIPAINVNNANIVIDYADESITVFSIRPTPNAKNKYNGIYDIDGCSIYAASTPDGVINHTAFDYAGEKSEVTVTDTYFYGLSLMRNEESKAAIKFGSGNFSSVSFKLATDGVTESTKVAFDDGVSEVAATAVIPMAFANSGVKELSYNGKTLKLDELGNMGFYTASATDVLAQYVVEALGFTSKYYVVAADADLSDINNLPADVNSLLPASVEGLYENFWTVLSSEADDAGIKAVKLAPGRRDALKTLSALQLYDSLNYVVYVPKAVITSGVVESITLAGKTVYTKGDEVKYVNIDGVDYLYLIKEVGAANASTKFDLVINHCYLDSAEVKAQKQTLSLANYARGVLDSTTVDAKGKQLIADVLYYVNAIRTYTGEVIPAEDEIVTLIASYTAAGFTPAAAGDVTVDAEDAKKTPTAGNITDAIVSVAANITKDAAKLRFTFDKTKYTGNINFSYTDLNGEVVTVTVNVGELEGDYYDLELRAYYLTSDITITTDAGETKANVYNFASYVKRMNRVYNNSGSANYDPVLYELVEALYAYSLSAKAYKS